MGYEVKFYFVHKCSYCLAEDKVPPSITVAMIDMGKVWYEEKPRKLLELFDRKADFSITVDEWNDEKNDWTPQDITEDCYGTPLHYCSNMKAAAKLAKEAAKETSIHTFKIFSDMLKGFSKYEDNMYCVLYGY